MTDPIADMLTQIRNAQLAHKHEITLPYSKFKFGLAQVLEKEGWIVGLASLNANRDLRILLKYDGRTPTIRGIKRVSKPGRRVYAGRHDLPRVMGGMGMAIISTPRGLMTDAEARKAKLGGEIVCELY